MIDNKNRIAYLECASGISGDMCLGALLDAGASKEELTQALKGIPLKGWRLEVKKVKRAGQTATAVNVKIARAEKPRTWKDMKAIVGKSRLKPEIKSKGLDILRGLFDAEMKVHGGPLEELHLHELGSIDTLVDIFGTLVALGSLGIKQVFHSPVNTGSGVVKTAHGVLTVPAPVTAELLRGIPVYSSGVPHELTTPTGAAILRGLRAPATGTACHEKGLSSGSMPGMTLERTGTGAGMREIKDRPNVLRVFIGWPAPQVTLIEANIDDMDPRIYEYLIEKLLGEGALDAFLTPVIMKKGRPGIKLTVLCRDRDMGGLADMVFRETTTLGLRFYSAERLTLPRKTEVLNTGLGRIRLKKAYLNGRILKEAPEYEDCKKAALKHNVPLREVLDRPLTPGSGRVRTR